jgi:hypothetical protein
VTSGYGSETQITCDPEYPNGVMLVADPYGSLSPDQLNPDRAKEHLGQKHDHCNGKKKALRKRKHDPKPCFPLLVLRNFYGVPCQMHIEEKSELE